jgi:hypothetical protein
MLSAKAYTLPSGTRRPGSFWRRVWRWLLRRPEPAGTDIRDLPDALRTDLGLAQPAPVRREDGFWDGRRGSWGRDLPL